MTNNVNVKSSVGLGSFIVPIICGILELAMSGNIQDSAIVFLTVFALELCLYVAIIPVVGIFGQYYITYIVLLPYVLPRIPENFHGILALLSVGYLVLGGIVCICITIYCLVTIREHWM